MLAPWKKSYDHLRILKSRDITLLTKVHIVKAMVFPIVMYGCESCIIKKAECCRINALELWCWRRLLRVTWTVRRSNQSILKDINPGYSSLEGLMLKLHHSDHLIWRSNSLQTTLMLGKTKSRRMGWQRVRWLDGITNSKAVSLREGEGGMFQENSIETCILSIVKEITSPGWMHETSAQAWCTGKTQRDRVEREVGAGSRVGWGIHVSPWLIHVNVRQNPLQYCN